MMWFMTGDGFPIWMMTMGLLFQLIFWRVRAFTRSREQTDPINPLLIP